MQASVTQNPKAVCDPLTKTLAKVDCDPLTKTLPKAVCNPLTKTLPKAVCDPLTKTTDCLMHMGPFLRDSVSRKNNNLFLLMPNFVLTDCRTVLVCDI